MSLTSIPEECPQSSAPHPNSEDFLLQMRTTRQSYAKKGSASTNAPKQLPKKAPKKFDELPEFKRVEAHRAVGEITGIENPFYRAHDIAAGATTKIGGKDFINFASYDYLGTNQHPATAKAASDAIKRFGISASASRLVAGERPVHGELEQRLAKNYGVDAAICFVSGYLANATSISAILGPQDLVVHDEYIHNSVLAGVKLSGAARRFFKHNDTDDLEHVLKTAASGSRRVLVIVEGIYSMDGDITNLPELIRLREQYGFWLMVDEAHSLGVLGHKGRGTFEHFGIDPTQVDIWMGTLSKTAASCGGYIAGSKALIDILRAEAGGFVYSVGLAPVLAAAAIASLDILNNEPQRVAKLQENGKLFRSLAQKLGLNTGLSEGYSVVPILVGDSMRAVQLSNDLHANGVNALPIIYPAVPEASARLRFFITCDHTPEQIATAVELTASKLEDLSKRNFGLSSIDLSQVIKLVS